MCDQTEVEYLPGQVVWARINKTQVWWPGEVQDQKELEEDDWRTKKPNLAVVKFFNEDSYAYVKTLEDIYHYNSLKKKEFIKKGLERERRQNKTGCDEKKFSKDILIAEKITNGDEYILNDPYFLPEKKFDFKDLIQNSSKVKDKSSKHKNNQMIKSKIKVKDAVARSKLEEFPFLIQGRYRCHLCTFSAAHVETLFWHMRINRGLIHYSYRKVGGQSQRFVLNEFAVPPNLRGEHIKVFKRRKPRKKKLRENIKAVQKGRDRQRDPDKKVDREAEVRDRLLQDWDDPEEAESDNGHTPIQVDDDAYAFDKEEDGEKGNSDDSNAFMAIMSQTEMPNLPNMPDGLPLESNELSISEKSVNREDDLKLSYNFKDVSNEFSSDESMTLKNTSV